MSYFVDLIVWIVVKVVLFVVVSWLWWCFVIGIVGVFVVGDIFDFVFVIWGGIWWYEIVVGERMICRLSSCSSGGGLDFVCGVVFRGFSWKFVVEIWKIEICGWIMEV